MTTKHGTASQVTGSYVEFQGAVLRALPRDINPDVALGWTQNIESLARVLRDALMPDGKSGIATPTFKRDMRKEGKEGWELLEDVEGPDPETALANGLEGVTFLKDGEQYVNGEELVRRARGELKANLGQRHAEYWLEHQEAIPEELRSCYLVFTGTIWRDRDGYRCVPGLAWGGLRWDLDFTWLGRGFRSYARLVRPRE